VGSKPSPVEVITGRSWSSSYSAILVAFRLIFYGSGLMITSKVATVFQGAP